MRLLFITLEFDAATFSGNGVYAQSQVRALRAQGHQVLLIAGRPEGGTEAQPQLQATDQLYVPLPRWSRLDEQSAWQEFAAGAATREVVAQVAAFAPEAVLGVDWSSLRPWQQLHARLPAQQSSTPFIYLNYRVYTRTASGDGRQLLQSLESEAVAEAAVTICLSSDDAAYIQEHLQHDPTALAPKVLLPALRADMEQLPPPVDTPSRRMGCTSHSSSSVAAACKLSDCSVAAGVPQTPPARSPATPGSITDKARQMAQSDAQANGSPVDSRLDGIITHSNGVLLPQPWQDLPGTAAERRRYLTCCVRLSPEKEPDRFVAAVEVLAQRCSPDGCQQQGTRLQALGVTPLLCGATQTPYAAALRQRLLAAVPDAVIQDQFLLAADLAEVYAATKLNVHPCCYDAYGMTIVEAASQGAPSLVAAGGAVGAADLLSGGGNHCFQMNMAAPAAQLADEIERLLQNGQELRAVGIRAAHKARSWTEGANAAQLIQIVKQALKRN